METMTDREKIISEFEDFVNGYECFCTSDDYEYKMHKAVLALLKDEKEYCDKCAESAIKTTVELQEEIARLRSLLKEQEAVVHPEPSCEMTYITDCCCDLCGVQLIREDNFCRCCGKPIDWSK